MTNLQAPVDILSFKLEDRGQSELQMSVHIE